MTAPMREKLKGALAFFHHEAAGGLVLVVAALVALLASNSPLAWLYDGFLHTPVGVRVGPLALDKSLLHWINDGLMAIFFFLVGLEIKRELLQGELSTFGQAALPVVAAIGGMVVPAVIYVAINTGDPVALRGWAIPTATDIAFAVGVLALLGPSIPSSLKIFLLALAIIDDLGAIIIIALFYTDNLSLLSLSLAAGGHRRAGSAQRARRHAAGALSADRLFIWVCVLKSGVHATLAGVAVALAIPLTSKSEGEPSLLEQLEESLHPWVAFAVLPLFAFANAGVSLQGLSLGQSAGADPARNRRGPVRRQGDRDFRRHLDRGDGRAGRQARRGDVAADPRRRHAGRHRLHHEPVHRHAGVPRSGRGRIAAAGRADGLAAVGGGGILDTGASVRAPARTS